MHLGMVDILFVILYLLVFAAVSGWSIRKSKDSPTDYFLANRNLGWFVILYLPFPFLSSNYGGKYAYTMTRC